ncbi:MAG: DUF6495 family protein [Bacteroidetes bacterium]|nr:DUF6495 family protein [Bacteroidota bacterium]
MKYKRLAKEELVELENEFVNFLASAQITGSDWEKMKQNEVEKAEELIDVFSDMVYEKVMIKIKYLEYRDNRSLNIYCCLEEKILLVGLRVKENYSLDLTADDLFDQLNESSNSAVDIIHSEKGYIKDRGIEVFELIQSGCYITNEKLFETIKGII